MFRRRHVLVTAVAAAGLLLLGGLPASAGQPYGYDISWPQCNSSGGSSFDSAKLVTPTSAALAILGVNDGKPNTINPCLGAQVTQAGTLSIQPTAISYYENTANPGSRYWPYGDPGCPAGVKHLSEDQIKACSFDYGFDAARYAYTYGSYGSANPTTVPNASTTPWWLDVESANSWTRDTAANIQTIKGAFAFLTSVGAPAGGIYTNSSSWSSITGNDQTTFSGYRWWAPGLVGSSPSASQLSIACGTRSLLGAGTPRYIQWTDTYDTDYDCG